MMNLETVLDRLNDERDVTVFDIHPATRNAKIWIGTVSLSGGYMPHNFAYARTARQAADCIGYDLPRRKLGELRRQYVTRYRGDTYEISQEYLTDHLAPEP